MKSRCHRTRRAQVLAALTLLLTAGSALAFSGGPPDGRTNAPGETNCTACHTTFALNSGAGGLSLAGLPANWQPGVAYDLTLTLADPNALRWGFELTVLNAGGASTGAIAITDAGTQLSTTGTRTYLKHTSAGTAPNTTVSHSWTLRWTAPAAGTGDVTLYVAGNAANNSGTNSGDRIYATSFASHEQIATPAPDVPVAFTLRGAAPNPFNPRTELRFELPQAQRVRVTVLTVDGRQVATPADHVFAAGPQSVSWDGRGDDGRPLESGTYLFVVEAGGERRGGRMTLLK